MRANNESDLPNTNPAPAPIERSHRRTGKIARLPDSDRQTLNQMLLDGAAYSVIIEKFAALGHKLTDNNISRWHSGGHQDWLDRQDCLAEMQETVGFAYRLKDCDRQHILSVSGIRVALFRLLNVLIVTDPVELKSKLERTPELYPRVLASVVKLTTTALKLDQYRRDNYSPN